MAAGTFTASLASPYRVDKASSGENQRPQKSTTPLALVGSVDTAAVLETGFLQASSTFDLANDPAANIKLVWTYGAGATICTVRLKSAMALTLDTFDWVEEYGIAASGVYTPTIFEAIITKATFDVTSPAVARMVVPYKDPRRRYFQVWAKVDNAGAANSLAGYVGGGTNE